MINRERELRYLENQQRRHVVQKGAEKFGEVVATAWQTIHPPAGLEIGYAFPDRQGNVTKWYSPEFFSYFPNPFNLDLYKISQDRVEKAKQNGKAVYDPKRDSRRYRDGRVVVRTEHVSELVKPGYLNCEGRLIRVGVSDRFFSEILRGGQTLDKNVPTFRRMAYEGQEIDLLREGGNSILVHEQFGTNSLLPSPLPEGAVIKFFDAEDKYMLEVIVLPIHKEFLPAHVGLLGPAEKNRLDAVMTRARRKGGRILVVYKEGYEGVVNGFIQPDSGVTDVYEVEEDKRTVKTFNGQPALSKSLPATKPGNLQVVTMSYKGKIETLVRGEIDVPEILPGADGVYGVDVIELGNASAAEKLVPIHFRNDEANHVSGDRVLAWQEEYKAYYLEYLKSLVPKKVHGRLGDDIKEYQRYIKSQGIVPEESAEEWLRRERKTDFLDYVRANAIMPVQPFMIQLKEVEGENRKLLSKGTVFEAASIAP